MKVLLPSTLSVKRAGAGADKLAEVLSRGGYSVLPLLDALHNRKTVEGMQPCAAVVFAEMMGYSKIAEVRNCATQANDAKIRCWGL